MMDIFGLSGKIAVVTGASSYVSGQMIAVDGGLSVA